MLYCDALINETHYVTAVFHSRFTAGQNYKYSTNVNSVSVLEDRRQIKSRKCSHPVQRQQYIIRLQMSMKENKKLGEGMTMKEVRYFGKCRFLSVYSTLTPLSRASTRVCQHTLWENNTSSAIPPSLSVSLSLLRNHISLSSNTTKPWTRTGRLPWLPDVHTILVKQIWK